MKSRSIIGFILIALSLQILSCSEELGASGAAGEWIKGKAL
jgi:hypothetical protein